MKVIIPMSGAGSRFVKQGYRALKPLIDVNGKPIIEWVTRMFDKNDEFIFICNKEHLNTTNMRKVLSGLGLNSKIIEIEPHKLGPVYAVSKAYEELSDEDKDIIVSYCDYYMSWDVLDFKKFIQNTECDGIIPCYTGFHPHLLPKKNLYASCRVDEENNLIEIREKFSFESDKTRAYHSPGIYYFRTGKLLKTYFDKMMKDKNELNGEFYVSLVYKSMLEDSKKIKIYKNISHFCQWGTPEDLEDYNFWMKEIK